MAYYDRMVTIKYDPAQPRDGDGKWAGGSATARLASLGTDLKKSRFMQELQRQVKDLKNLRWSDLDLLDELPRMFDFIDL